MTPAERSTIRTALDAAALTDPVLATAISGNNDTYVLGYLRTAVSPDYWVWNPRVDVNDIYHKSSPTGSFWAWGLFKSQQVTEQGTWAEMFRSGFGFFDLVNFRAGVFEIFKGTAQNNAQRAHIFAHGRRKANFSEKTLAVAVASPSVDTGNDVGQALGNAANPAQMTFVGEATFDDVALILRPPA